MSSFALYENYEIGSSYISKLNLIGKRNKITVLVTHSQPHMLVFVPSICHIGYSKGIINRV